MRDLDWKTLFSESRIPFEHAMSTVYLCASRTHRQHMLYAKLDRRRPFRTNLYKGEGRSVELKHATHRLRTAVLVKLPLDLPPHVGQDGRDHKQTNPASQSEGPGESIGQSGLVEVETGSALVHNEEHCVLE